jgi:hypothetical protein
MEAEQTYSAAMVSHAATVYSHTTIAASVANVCL